MAKSEPHHETFLSDALIKKLRSFVRNKLFSYSFHAPRSTSAATIASSSSSMILCTKSVTQTQTIAHWANSHQVPA